jgi:hypothetical protein
MSANPQKGSRVASKQYSVPRIGLASRNAYIQCCQSQGNHLVGWHALEIGVIEAGPIFFIALSGFEGAKA